MTPKTFRTLQRSLRKFHFIAFLLIALMSLARGQESGTLRGIVVNGRGDHVQGATVELFVSTDKMAKYVTRSSADGTFRLGAVIPGEYTVKVTAIGFPPNSTWVKIIAGRESDLRKILIGSVDCSQPGVICDDFGYMKAELQLSCIRGAKLLRNASGSPAVLPFGQLDARAIHRGLPNWPKEAMPGTTVTVYVVIDVRGKIMCTTVIGTPGATERAALQAAQEWEFQPVLDNGVAIAVIGKLEFQVPGK